MCPPKGSPHSKPKAMIDDDDLVATKRALAKRPEAVLYGLRIGYPAAYRLGGHFTVPQR
jgi:hypothetical protein